MPVVAQGTDDSPNTFDFQARLEVTKRREGTTFRLERVVIPEEKGAVPDELSFAGAGDEVEVRLDRPTIINFSEVRGQLRDASLGEAVSEAIANKLNISTADQVKIQLLENIIRDQIPTVDTDLPSITNNYANERVTVELPPRRTSSLPSFSAAKASENSETITDSFTTSLEVPIPENVDITRPDIIDIVENFDGLPSTVTLTVPAEDISSSAGPILGFGNVLTFDTEAEVELEVDAQELLKEIIRVREVSVDCNNYDLAPLFNEQRDNLVGIRDNAIDSLTNSIESIEDRLNDISGITVPTAGNRAESVPDLPDPEEVVTQSSGLSRESLRNRIQTITDSFQQLPSPQERIGDIEDLEPVDFAVCGRSVEPPRELSDLKNTIDARIRNLQSRYTRLERFLNEFGQIDISCPSNFELQNNSFDRFSGLNPTDVTIPGADSLEQIDPVLSGRGAQPALEFERANVPTSFAGLAEAVRSNVTDADAAERVTTISEPVPARLKKALLEQATLLKEGLEQGEAIIPSGPNRGSAVPEDCITNYNIDQLIEDIENLETFELGDATGLDECLNQLDQTTRENINNIRNTLGVGSGRELSLGNINNTSQFPIFTSLEVSSVQDIPDNLSREELGVDAATIDSVERQINNVEQSLGDSSCATTIKNRVLEDARRVVADLRDRFTGPTERERELSLPCAQQFESIERRISNLENQVGIQGNIEISPFSRPDIEVTDPRELSSDQRVELGIPDFIIEDTENTISDLKNIISGDRVNVPKCEDEFRTRVNAIETKFNDIKNTVGREFDEAGVDCREANSQFAQQLEEWEDQVGLRNDIQQGIWIGGLGGRDGLGSSFARSTTDATPQTIVGIGRVLAQEGETFEDVLVGANGLVTESAISEVESWKNTDIDPDVGARENAPDFEGVEPERCEKQFAERADTIIRRIERIQNQENIGLTCANTNPDLAQNIQELENQVGIEGGIQLGEFGDELIAPSTPQEIPAVGSDKTLDEIIPQSVRSNFSDRINQIKTAITENADSEECKTEFNERISAVEQNFNSILNADNPTPCPSQFPDADGQVKSLEDQLGMTSGENLTLGNFNEISVSDPTAISVGDINPQIGLTESEINSFQSEINSVSDSIQNLDSEICRQSFNNRLDNIQDIFDQVKQFRFGRRGEPGLDCADVPSNIRNKVRGYVDEVDTFISTPNPGLTAGEVDQEIQAKIDEGRSLIDEVNSIVRDENPCKQELKSEISNTIQSLESGEGFDLGCQDVPKSLRNRVSGYQDEISVFIRTPNRGLSEEQVDEEILLKIEEGQNIIEKINTQVDDANPCKGSLKNDITRSINRLQNARDTGPQVRIGGEDVIDDEEEERANRVDQILQRISEAQQSPEEVEVPDIEIPDELQGGN